jgi:hypothetical protein
MPYKGNQHIQCTGETKVLFGVARKIAGMSENNFIVYLLQRASQIGEGRRER